MDAGDKPIHFKPPYKDSRSEPKYGGHYGPYILPCGARVEGDPLPILTQQRGYVTCKGCKDFILTNEHLLHDESPVA